MDDRIEEKALRAQILMKEEHHDKLSEEVMGYVADLEARLADVDERDLHVVDERANSPSDESEIVLSV